MSSLRVDSLRLIWLEAFIAVADHDNYSRAAEELGLDQSTLSRYLKSLEQWLGRDLIKPLSMEDGNNTLESVTQTAEGTRFYARAKVFVRAMHRYRTDEARAAEMLSAMEGIAEKLSQDVSRKNRLFVTKANIEEMQKILTKIAEMRENPNVASLEYLYPYVRTFFKRYEPVRNKQLRLRRSRKALAPELEV